MNRSTDTPRDPRSLNADEAERLLTGWGHKSYRVTQLLGWLYKKRADSIDAMSDLPQVCANSSPTYFHSGRLSWRESNVRGTAR